MEEKELREQLCTVDGSLLFLGLLLLSVGSLLFESASISNGGILILLSCLCGGAMAGILGGRPRKKRKR